MNDIRKTLPALFCLCLLVACGDDGASRDTADASTPDAPDTADTAAPDTTTPDTADTAAIDAIDTTDTAEPIDTIDLVDAADTADVTDPIDTADTTAPIDTAPPPCPAGTPCDDGDACTHDDRCDDAGACVGIALICDAPPRVDVAAACAAASTVDVYLGTGCGGACDAASGACVYTPTTFPCPDPSTAASELAQTRGWQIALRAGLAKFAASDFDITLAPTNFDPVTLDDPELTFRLWVASERSWYTAPASDGLRLPSDTFVLAGHIEQPDGVRGGASTTEINGMIFWDRWDWAGNPYHGLRAAALRAFVMSAVDLIMIDTVHEPGTLYAQQHFLSGTMNWMSGAYLDALPHLDACTSAAYRLGLQTQFELLEQWDNNNGNNDMVQPSHIALYEAALAMPDPSWMTRAEAESREVFESSGYWHESAGYFDHGVALDSTYEGITTHMLTAAALRIPWAHLQHGVAKYARLKSYMVLPEPDGTSFASPSHWNPATGGGVNEDQWWSYHREVGTAMLTDDAMYLLVGGRNIDATFNPFDLDAMRAAVTARIPALDAKLTTPIEGYVPVLWAPRHWSTGRMASVLDYQPGFYAHLTALAAAKSPLLLPPMSRGDEFVENFGDDFIVARFHDYAAIVYAGPIADAWAQPLAGFGGGALSAFWTPTGGSFLLGFTRGSQNPHPDSWDELPDWPMQHLYGTTEAVARFTTALVQHPERTVATTTDSATIDIAGTIGAEAWSTETALSVAPTYTRKITIAATGVTVATTLQTTGDDRVCDLIDVIPLYLHDQYQAAPVPEPIVTLIAANGDRAAASDAWTNAVEVEVERFTGKVLITLDHARRVRLAPDTWSNLFQIAPKRSA